MSKLVMLVDDDLVFQEIVLRATRSLPDISEILPANDGAHGIELIKARLAACDRVPDVIFVDINMPILDGFGFLREFAKLREQHPELLNVKPIAMLTSSDQGRDRDKALELGADEYLIKGARIAEIRKGIVGCIA